MKELPFALGPANNPHPSKTNMAPENGPLGKDIPVGKHFFSWSMLVLDCLNKNDQDDMRFVSDQK